MQQWQNHVTAAEHQRAGLVELGKSGQARSAYRCRQQRQAKQQPGKDEKEQTSCPLAETVLAVLAVHGGWEVRQGQGPPADQAAQPNRQELAMSSRQGQDEQGRADADTAPQTVRAKGAGHAPDRLGDDGDGDDLQAMQRAGLGQPGPVADTEREEDQGDGGRQREPQPGGQRPQPAGAPEAERHADLTACRAGQELAEGDKIGVVPVIQPLPAVDELAAEISQMGHRPTKGGQPQTEKGQHDLDGRTPLVGAGLPARH